MFRVSSAALTTLLALSVASLAGAQQASSDTAHHSQAPLTRDERHDRRTISADSTKLHHDIAVRDSVRSAVEADHDRTHAATLRADSLQAVLAAARKATPRDSAAIKRDLAALNQAKRALDQDLDRDKRAQAELVAINHKVDRESNTTIDARRDLRGDRSTPPHTSSNNRRQ
jgi:hypothetical protein